MATITLHQGQSIQSDNHTIYKIAQGSIDIRFPGGILSAEKGDMFGVLELLQDSPFFTYEASTDVTLMTLPVKDINGLLTQISASAGIGKALYSLALKQYSTLVQSFERSYYAYESLYKSLRSDYEQYDKICAYFGSAGSLSEEMDALPNPERNSNLAISAFYDQFVTNPANPLMKEIGGNAWSATYFIYHIATDTKLLMDAFDDLNERHLNVIRCYINDDATGLVSSYLNLLGKFRSNCDEAQTLISTLRFTLESLSADSHVESDLITSYSEKLDTVVTRFASEPTEETQVVSEVKSNVTNEEAEAGIANSLQTIMQYAGWPQIDQEPVFKAVRAFEGFADRASTDDDVRNVCRVITGAFVKLYTRISQLAVKDQNVPIVVKMFLYFGYMDEGVAGKEASIDLYKLAAGHRVDPASNVYPFFDWLCAIYRGDKEPSRNEFEQDYADAVHQRKVQGEINATEEKALLADQIKKVAYEVENVFPSVNKITYGRISTYCPIFSDQNLPFSLTKSMISKEALWDEIDYIEGIDFSVFEREILYSNMKAGINKEYVHTNVTPDFILMPNVGIRGAMWQEIEAKKRSTPCRMMMPIFLLGDLRPIVLHMTGEYRWEMCKRIQGARWNDLSDPSLTSEFFDYVQFYRKNLDLSPEAKEKVKNNLVRAKNNYKEMFIYDYVAWVMYESSGSPRLNKVSRGILCKYAPFAKDIRVKLAANPQFQTHLERYDRTITQTKHKYDVMRQKFANLGIDFPDELEQELIYLDK